MRAMNDTPLIEAAEIIAARFGIEPELTTWIARKLETADLIDLAAPSPINLARLLVAVIGSGRPADAPSIVRAYESANFECVASLDGEGRFVSFNGEQLAADPATADLARLVDRDPVATLADLIALAVERGSEPELDAGRIEIERSVESPLLRIWMKDSAGKAARVFAWRGKLQSAGSHRLQVSAIVPGSIVNDLAPFATGWFAPLLESAYQMGA